MSLYVSQEKNNHYRTFARITDVEDTGKVHFEIRKRDREVIAERALYKGEDTTLYVTGGKHKDKDWATGIVFRWNF